LIRIVERTKRTVSLGSMWLFVLCLVLVACDASPRDDGRDVGNASRVAVATPGPAGFGERFSLTGTLTAERASELSPRVDGLVARVLVDAGDFVETGDVLLELDADVSRQALSRARAQVAEAAAAVAEAERLFTEANRLSEANSIAASQVAAREAALQLARATFASARASEREQAELVERHALPAPFAGVVAEKHTEAGEWVQRGTPVLSLVAIDRVRLDLRVPQERYGQIDDETEIRVFADSLGDEPLQARVGARVPVTDPSARTFLLRLLVDDPADRLLPGTSARAEIDLPATEAALSVSRDALLRQPDGSYSLFVVTPEDGRLVARQRTVRVLRDQGDQVAVGDGLTRGERVVIRGNESLRDGQPVQPVED
jgi:RND family efflux transporter MFP subunit